MSTQITLPAPRRMSWGRTWILAVLVAATVGLGVTGYLALRNDGQASSGPAASRLAEPGSAQITAAQADAVPNAHNSAGFKRAAERPGWVAPGRDPAPRSDGGCTIIGRRPC